MANIYHPVIEAEDFDAIMQILDLRMSYDEWLKVSYARWHPDHKDKDAVDVDVRVVPDVFARYLSVTNSSRKLETLLPFVESISGGTRY